MAFAGEDESIRRIRASESAESRVMRIRGGSLVGKVFNSESAPDVTIFGFRYDARETRHGVRLGDRKQP